MVLSGSDHQVDIRVSDPNDKELHMLEDTQAFLYEHYKNISSGID